MKKLFLMIMIASLLVLAGCSINKDKGGDTQVYEETGGPEASFDPAAYLQNLPEQLHPMFRLPLSFLVPVHPALSTALHPLPVLLPGTLRPSQFLLPRFQPPELLRHLRQLPAPKSPSEWIPLPDAVLPPEPALPDPVPEA